MFLSSCSLLTDSPDECWSTERLRLQAGRAVFEVPAEVRPTPDPSRMQGLLSPNYAPGTDTGKAKLIWCQDHQHVPLKVNSFSLSQAATAASLQAVEVIRIDPFASPSRRGHGDLPDARHARQWTIWQSEDGGDFTRYEMTGLDDKKAVISCHHIQVVNSNRVTDLCSTNVAVGDFAEMYVAFTGDGMTPAQYVDVVQAAALLIEEYHIGAERNRPKT